MMWWQTALLVALLVHQAPAEFAKPVFIEDVVDRSGSRIVSGWEARPGQHPHQVSLRQVSPIGGVSGCGGSVVHREWVITAAHCTAGSVTVVIRAGVTQLIRPKYIFESTEWYNYPTFNENTPTVVQPNDIAILKLLRSVTYSDYLRPIRIQRSSDAFRNYEGLQVYASGFGRLWTGGATPETLNWVYLLGVSNARCRSIFGTIITDNTICAAYYNVTSQSICQGDSGGPLVHEDSDGVPYLIGVSSFVAGGSFGCHSGLPGGFIRPGPFLSWFEQVTGIDFENLNEEDEDSGEEEETTTLAPTTTESPTEPPTTPLPEPETPTPTPPPEPDTPTPTPPPESESDEDSDENDPELSEILKRLEVKVKVKVRFTKSKSKKEA